MDLEMDMSDETKFGFAISVVRYLSCLLDLS